MDELSSYRLSMAEEKFDKKYSKYISIAFQIRNNCDYDDFFIVSKDDAVEQYNNACELYEAVKNFLR